MRSSHIKDTLQFHQFLKQFMLICIDACYDILLVGENSQAREFILRLDQQNKFLSTERLLVQLNRLSSRHRI